MNSLVAVNICIVSLHLCILVSLTSASELGISSCRYLGEMEEDGKKCHEDVVKIEKLPKHCSSFVYLGIVYNYNIKPSDPKYGLERLRSLIDYENRAHHVFLFYSHSSVDEFYSLLYEGKFAEIAQQMQNFIRDYPVKGLILHGIEPAIKELVGDFLQRFVSYLKALKDINPDLEIGMYLSARSLIENANDMDLSDMNTIMDFYLIEFLNFNDCSKDLLHGGITPMDSSNSDIVTLNRFGAALENSTIAKDKIYFEFLISPKPKPNEIENFKPCEISYNEYCENEDDKINKWCVDDSDILYKKGAFTKKYANGFVGSYIDLVDRDDKCGCGKYSTFDMMVNGFNGKTDPKSCPQNYTASEHMH
ncbi:uncharacterized protein LOC111030896 [Myzus persicae]|uniref:uncharacterized protein LOC111030896 n=1 Tax=Myzus persicae TaxID=13164 RepID=UPI000B930B4D|nr:uncharacterized protein LOC111030896 [Myzus persicae]